jgi:hypothetical protein
MSKIVELLKPYGGTAIGWATIPARNYNEALELIKQLEQDLQIYKEEYKSMSAFLNKEGWTK